MTHSTLRTRIARPACIAGALLAFGCGRTGLEAHRESDGSGGTRSDSTSDAVASSADGPTTSSSAASASSGTTCVPSVEVCDGIDNDCNGLVDESDPSIGMSCDTGIPGACAAGMLACTDGSLGCAPVTGPMPETCDGIDNDCNGLVDDTSCLPKTVFVSSQAFTGDLGGLSGADSICQSLASAAGLSGQFKAWLSATTESAAQRLNHSTAAYVLVDGTKVADDWSDLVDNTVDHAIDLTEQGGPPPATTACAAVYPAGTTTVWSGSTGHGDLLGGDLTCGNFTTTMGSLAVGCSGASFLGQSWASCCVNVDTCSSTAAIYCFEQ